MNGAHLASPIRGELGYAQWPQLGSQIHSPIGNQRKDDVCPNFALTAAKFMFSNSGNSRAKANSPKPRSCPKRPFGQWMGQNSSADWVMSCLCPAMHGQWSGAATAAQVLSFRVRGRPLITTCVLVMRMMKKMMMMTTTTMKTMMQCMTYHWYHAVSFQFACSVAALTCEDFHLANETIDDW